MTEPNANYNHSEDRAKRTINRLVFAAIKEQTVSRRWRIGFTLFFISYLTIVTTALFTAASSGDDGADGDGKHTALVKLSGVIASGEAADSENIIQGLKDAFKHQNTAGIVLEINSPGGSPVQSAYIFDEIRRLKALNEGIPVYAVVADMAASGGYFVAAAADKIYVNRSSLVGSIGVRMDAFGFVGMMEKLGVERRLLVAGENKGLFDPFLPENAAHTSHLKTMLDQVHDHFISSVKLGRGDRLSTEADLFSGLIWSGEQAINLGLVDDYGTTPGIARELGAERLVDFTPKTELIDRIADRIGATAGHSITQYISGGMELK